MSKGGHLPPLDKAQAQRVNKNLLSALPSARPLALDGVTLSYRFAHIGPDLYPKGSKAGLHRHAVMQVEYVLNGLFEISDAGRRISAPAFNGVLILPEHRHAWRCVESGNMLGIDVNVIGPARRGFFRAMRQAFAGGMRNFKSPRLKTWSTQFVSLAFEPGRVAWRGGLIGSLMHLWLAETIKCCFDVGPWTTSIPHTGDRPDDRRRHLIRQALDFMHENYGLPIRIADVAQHVGITPRHLNRVFSDHNQESAHATLMRIRLERARDMLKADASCSAKEAAYRCGFASPSYFSQCFKRMFGMSPSGAIARPLQSTSEGE